MHEQGDTLDLGQAPSGGLLRVEMTRGVAHPNVTISWTLKILGRDTSNGRIRFKIVHIGGMSDYALNPDMMFFYGSQSIRDFMLGKKQPIPVAMQDKLVVGLRFVYATYIAGKHGAMTIYDKTVSPGNVVLIDPGYPLTKLQLVD